MSYSLTSSIYIRTRLYLIIKRRRIIITTLHRSLDIKEDLIRSEISLTLIKTGNACAKTIENISIREVTRDAIIRRPRLAAKRIITVKITT